jgi:predicted flavoprotein YhiN
MLRARVPQSHPQLDVLVLGGGAAGLFCAFTAARRGRRVRVLERANKVGKKILMSGGGRCNFTNLNVTADNFLSANPHFCKSALARYKPEAFIALVERHGIAYHEKELGQLFCEDSSRQIVQLLLDECAASGVRIDTGCEVHRVARDAGGGFAVDSSVGELRPAKLVVATGGLSVPTLGGSGLGYELARQFGHGLLPTRAGLVPLTLSGRPLEQWQDLAGVSLPVSASAGGARFDNAMLVTHRGLSGPAMLQISNYWNPSVGAAHGREGPGAGRNPPVGAAHGREGPGAGRNPSVGAAHGRDRLRIDLLPGRNALELLVHAQRARPRIELVTLLAEWWPRRFAERFDEVFCRSAPWARPSMRLADYKHEHFREIAEAAHGWPVVPSGTEGYRTAEVTLGGVDTREISSTTFESRRVPGLYFIGEVLDVTGWLGGYNFQWAWASAHACGEAV